MQAIGCLSLSLSHTLSLPFSLILSISLVLIPIFSLDPFLFFSVIPPSLLQTLSFYFYTSIEPIFSSGDAPGGSRDIGNSYVFFFDIISSLLSAMADSYPELLAPYLPNLEKWVWVTIYRQSKVMGDNLIILYLLTYDLSHLLVSYSPHLPLFHTLFLSTSVSLFFSLSSLFFSPCFVVIFSLKVCISHIALFIFLSVPLSLSDSPSIYFYLFISLFIYLCIYLSIYLPIYLCVFSSVCSFIYLSIYPSIYLPIYLSIYLFIYLSIYLFIYLSICLSMHLLIYLSIYLSMYIFLITSLPLFLTLLLSIDLIFILLLHFYSYL